eukprot:UN03977
MTTLLLLASQSGMVIVNTCNRLRPHGRTTRGMGAMRLEEDDKMAAMDIIPSTTHTMPGKLSAGSET